MPVINLPEHKERKKREYRPNSSDSKKDNEINRLVYNTRRWRDLRLYKLSLNPLCEVCEQNHKLKLATQVHHKKEISTGVTIEDKRRLGFDINNLQALCTKCHKDQHKNE